MKHSMLTKGVHPRLWGYLLQYEADVHNRTWNPKTGCTLWESVYGNTPDISEFLDFAFYDWVWFWEPGNKKASIGCWLGVNHSCQEALSSHVLKENGEIVACTMVQALTKDDLAIPNYKFMMERHEHQSNKSLTIQNPKVKIDNRDDNFRRLFHDDDTSLDIDFSVEAIDEADKYDVDTYNRLVGAQIELNRGGETVKGRVKDRARDEFGCPVGTYDNNPLLDTAQYVVEYYDGSRC
mmetsp:Transcript_12116/g.18274  ORF Transcript_12116/g.18274 Transcript_12116/m.18274 type:complete len:237 (-) Transcript_12116:801-1511(-)